MTARSLDPWDATLRARAPGPAAGRSRAGLAGLDAVADKLAREGVCLVSDAPMDFANDLAADIVAGRVPPALRHSQLLVCPDDAHDIADYIAALADADSTGLVAVLDAARLQAASAACTEDLGRLFIRSDLKILVLGSASSAALNTLLQARLRAQEGMLDFIVRFYERLPPAPGPKLLHIRAPHGQAVLLCEDRRRQAAALHADPLSPFVPALVKQFRADGHQSASEQGSVTATALCVYAAGLPLRAACSHLLSIQATGQRFRLHRAAFTTHAGLNLALAAAPDWS